MPEAPRVCRNGPAWNIWESTELVSCEAGASGASAALSRGTNCVPAKTQWLAWNAGIYSVCQRSAAQIPGFVSLSGDKLECGGGLTVGGGDGICLLRVSEAEEHHYGLNTTKTKPRLSGAPQSAPPSGEGDGTGVSRQTERGSLSQLLKNNKVCDAVSRFLWMWRENMWQRGAGGRTTTLFWTQRRRSRHQRQSVLHSFSATLVLVPNFSSRTHFTPLLYLITGMQYTSSDQVLAPNTYDLTQKNTSFYLLFRKSIHSQVQIIT